MGWRPREKEKYSEEEGWGGGGVKVFLFIYFSPEVAGWQFRFLSFPHSSALRHNFDNFCSARSGNELRLQKLIGRVWEAVCHLRLAVNKAGNQTAAVRQTAVRLYLCPLKCPKLSFSLSHTHTRAQAQ